MTVLEWIFFVAFGLLVIAAVRGLLYIWRGQSRVWDRQPGWWPWGKLAYRAWVRIMPIGVATLGVLEAIFLVSELGAVESDGLAFWAGAILVLLLLTLFLLATTVAFYNRPKWIVPPHLRDEPGIVEAQKAKGGAPEP